MPLNVGNLETTEEDPQHKGISWWLENTLIRVFKRFLNESKDFLVRLLAKSTETAIEGLESDLIPIIRPFAQQILDMPGIPEYVKSPLRDALLGTSQGGLLIIGAIVLALGETIKMGFVGPLTRKMQMQVDSVVRSALFNPELLIEMWKRGIISEVDCDKFLAANGVSNTGIVALKRMKKPLLDDTTLTQLYWRKEITADALSSHLEKRGLTATQIVIWKQVRQIIPAPSALVSIAVREGFNDQIAQTFGYDENYPTIAAEWAEKGGMNQYFFKALWRAHWNLPGLIQVRDMYHRGIVSDRELDTYLLAADYPSYWRNAIKKWMFAIVTRVDARRMYDLGIWSIERVYQHNLELGYNPDDAQSMTEWIALSYAEEERELTKTDILSMFRDGILNEQESTRMLESLDFNFASIALMLAHQDLKRDEQYERAILKNVKDLFIAGIYDRQDVLIQLGKLNTPPDVIRQSLAIWYLEKERKVVRPSVTQLRDMAQKGIISLEQWKEEMANRRYSNKYIEWYRLLWLEE